MNRHPAYWFVLTAILILIVGEGCGKDEALPEPVVDRSECAKCRMLISDARYTAMLRTSDYLMFDDIGCMLAYEQTISPKEIKGSWVRDYFSNTWIETNEAIFFRTDHLKTPMEYGYIATSQKQPEPASLLSGRHERIENIGALRKDFSTRFLSRAK